jgi:ankyrin repeat protein
MRDMGSRVSDYVVQQARLAPGGHVLSEDSKWFKLKDLMRDRGQLGWGSNAMRSVKVKSDLENSDIFDLMIPLIAEPPPKNDNPSARRTQAEVEHDRAVKWSMEALKNAFASGRSPDKWLGPKTPLRAAVYHGRKDLVDLLLEGRANPNLPEGPPEPETPTVTLAGGEGAQARRIENRENKARSANTMARNNSFANMKSASMKTLPVTNSNSPPIKNDKVAGGAQVLASSIRLQNSGSKRHSASTYRKKKDLSAALPQDPNVNNGTGSTPLHLAVWNNDLGIIRALLDARANTNIGDNQKQTPLFFAEKNEVCELLLSRRARVDCLNLQRQTALHFAARAGHKNVMRTILKHSPPSVTQQMDAYGAKAAYYAKQAGLDHNFTLRSGLQAPVIAIGRMKDAKCVG